MNKQILTTIFYILIFTGCKKEANPNDSSVNMPISGKSNRFVSSNPNEKFGYCVSLSADGNTAIAGSFQTDAADSGTAYIYTRSGSNWNFQKSLLGFSFASSIASQANQGISVDISDDGNAAIVGAVGDQANILSTAFIYHRIGSIWTQDTIIISGLNYTILCDENSVSISGDGNTALVKAYDDNTNLSVVLIYSKVSGIWTRTNVITVEPSNLLVEAGSIQISSDGNIIAIVKKFPTISGIGYNGKIDVYKRAGSNWFKEGLNLEPGPGNPDDYEFGRSISLSSDGSVIMAGFTGALNPSSLWSAGGVYVIKGSLGLWAQYGKITNDISTTQFDDIGNSVSISNLGYEVAVGGNTRSDGGPTLSRKNVIFYYKYDSPSSSWKKQGDYIIDNNSNPLSNADNVFGYALSISGNGNTILAGNAGTSNVTKVGHIIFFYR